MPRRFKTKNQMERDARMGEMDWGGYTHDAVTNATGGALAGAVLGEGIGAVPGAVGGAAFGVGSHAAKDIWYATRSKEDKAAWQADDVETTLKTLSDTVDKVNPELAAKI